MLGSNPSSLRANSLNETNCTSKPTSKAEASRYSVRKESGSRPGCSMWDIRACGMPGPLSELGLCPAPRFAERPDLKGDLNGELSFRVAVPIFFIVQFLPEMRN